MPEPHARTTATQPRVTCRAGGQRRERGGDLNGKPQIIDVNLGFASMLLIGRGVRYDFRDVLVGELQQHLRHLYGRSMRGCTEKDHRQKQRDQTRDVP